MFASPVLRLTRMGKRCCLLSLGMHLPVCFVSPFFWLVLGMLKDGPLLFSVVFYIALCSLTYISPVANGFALFRKGSSRQQGMSTCTDRWMVKLRPLGLVPAMGENWTSAVLEALMGRWTDVDWEGSVTSVKGAKNAVTRPRTGAWNVPFRLLVDETKS